MFLSVSVVSEHPSTPRGPNPAPVDAHVVPNLPSDREQDYTRRNIDTGRQPCYIHVAVDYYLCFAAFDVCVVVVRRYCNYVLYTRFSHCAIPLPSARHAEHTHSNRRAPFYDEVWPPRRAHFSRDLRCIRTCADHQLEHIRRSAMPCSSKLLPPITRKSHYVTILPHNDCSTCVCVLSQET